MTADLARLRELLERATPGNWKVYESLHPYRDGTKTHHERRIGTESDHPQLKGPYPVVTLSIGIGLEGEKAIHFVGIEESDAELIAAMKNALPALLTELEGLRRDAERYRWLRDGDADTDMDDFPIVHGASTRNTLFGDDLDAAIDAAKDAKTEGAGCSDA